ncbi:MAG TPA: MgtC/SapB family protein, partial [Thermoanaerobaculia bacterium]
MDLASLFVKLGIGLGLGLLVGLEREKSASEMAGVRTIPLITVWGTVATWLSLRFGGGVIAASILALAALIVVSNVHQLRKGDYDGGLTSEMAILAMFGVGALLAVGPTEIAIAIGGGVAVLLHA